MAGEESNTDGSWPLYATPKGVAFALCTSPGNYVKEDLICELQKPGKQKD